MKRLFVLLFMLPLSVFAQTEDDFLPEVSTMVIDSAESAVQRYCKDIIAHTSGYKIAFIDREDVMMSKYFYDNQSYETVKMEFQFGVTENEIQDSTGTVISTKKSRTVRLIRITAELNTITDIYNYIFTTSFTPEKIMAISRYDKPVSYKGQSFNSTVVSDDFKAGYWTLSFYKL